MLRPLGCQDYRREMEPHHSQATAEVSHDWRFPRGSPGAQCPLGIPIWTRRHHSTPTALALNSPPLPLTCPWPPTHLPCLPVTRCSDIWARNQHHPFLFLHLGRALYGPLTDPLPPSLSKVVAASKTVAPKPASTAAPPAPPQPPHSHATVAPHPSYSARLSGSAPPPPRLGWRRGECASVFSPALLAPTEPSPGGLPLHCRKVGAQHPGLGASPGRAPPSSPLDLRAGFPAALPALRPTLCDQ